jgi:hypothetical protein
MFSLWTIFQSAFNDARPTLTAKITAKIIMKTMTQSHWKSHCKTHYNEHIVLALGDPVV